MIDAKRILERAQSREGWVADLLAELVSVRSPSCGEREVIELACERMREVGFDEVRVDGLGSAVGQIGSGKRVVAIDAHVDTVGAGEPSLWSMDPFDGRVEGGKVWGRGAADQKGGLASMILAGRIVKELGLAGDVTLLCTATVMEEDCDGLCWRHLIEEEGIRPDVCVITEPTGLAVYRGQRGRMEMEVGVKGVSAHGSAPERGDNAIYRMSRIVAEIEALGPELGDDDFLGRGTAVVSDISSTAPSLCSVPDSCRIHIDRRLTAGEGRELAVSQIEKIAAGHGGRVVVPEYREASYTGKVFPMEKYYPSWIVPEDAPAVTAARAAFKGLFNSEARVGRWTFSTNGVAICGLHGIPCVGFGPGFEQQAHAPDEWTPAAHLWKAAAFYAMYPFVLAKGSTI